MEWKYKWKYDGVWFENKMPSQWCLDIFNIPQRNPQTIHFGTKKTHNILHELQFIGLNHNDFCTPMIHKLHKVCSNVP